MAYTPAMLLLLCVLVAGCAWPANAADEPCARGATTLLVVRHAEKPGQADSLSAAGAARARELAHVAANAGVRAIYRTDTARNRLTAAPLAEALGLSARVYAAKEYDALIARIFAEHEGETVLVVGHSNTVTKIVAAAGGPALDDLSETEYDTLFVVTIPACRRGASTLTVLQYGEPTP
jgi:broad specificity phosphatase PhoE